MSLMIHQLTSLFRFLAKRSMPIIAIWIFGALCGALLLHVSADRALAASCWIQVKIYPEAARAAGAKWEIRYVSPSTSSWYGPFNSHYWATAGTNGWSRFEVRCTEVSGWTKPANELFWLRDWQSKSLSVWYTAGAATTTTTTAPTTTTTTTTTTTSTTSTTTTTTTPTTTTTTTTTLPGATCLNISDVPMDTQLQAAPASVMFVIDDSGSMDWEFMTTESDGIFQGKYYNFDMSDNAYSDYYNVDGSEKRLWKARWSDYNKMYYNPSVEYTPWPNYSDASTTAPRSNPVNSSPTLSPGGTYITVTQGTVVDNQDSDQFSTTGSWNYSSSASGAINNNHHYTSTSESTATWTLNIPTAGTYEIYAYCTPYYYRSDCTGWDCNASYTVTYGSGTTTPAMTRTQNGWFSLGSYSFNAGGGSVTVTRPSGSGHGSWTGADAVKFVPSGATDIDVKNAHYYVYSDTEDTPYLIVLDGTITYYRFTDNAVDNVDQAGLVADTTPPGDVVPKNDGGSNRSYTEELQNFANWFSFYRRRELTAKAAIAKVIDDIEGVKVGFYSINHRLNQTVLPVNVTQGGTTYDNTNTLLNLLYGLYSSGGTPLRDALKDVGDYFDQAGGTSDIGTSPYASAADGGACQQSFAIVMTDGYWNGSVSGIGNEDGDQGDPYADTWSATLADVAMKYYKTDLSSTLTDLVPANFPDMATWQHMVTYGISFGVNGTLNPYDYDLYNSDPAQRVYPTWPDPHSGSQTRKIDDLWHASVNGRGQFLSASDPEDLIDSLQALMENVMSRVGSGASISINGEELHSGSNMYQASYSTDNWTGDVKAYAINQTTGAVIRDNPLWSASDELDAVNWDTDRIIATYNTATSAGIPFRYNSLSTAQQAMVDQDMLNYLRGDNTNELSNGGLFRDRDSKLGDIVHSSPFYFKDVVYAGGNDGMLHAFDVRTGLDTSGKEIFAYVPGLVFADLTHLTNFAYAHRYYVDLTPYMADTGSVDLLVGGLGKGGKGYYCLDVTDAASISSESTLANRVKWEFPNASTTSADIADIGYSYSEAYILQSYDTDHPWVVIFGNGYASTNEHAVLFVLDAFTGNRIAKIDTGVGSCNGLSTPVPVDVDMDNKVDYVYAGDLKGNLWKFDFTDTLASNWELAYSSALFQAKDDSGNTQPITTKPDVMFHCDPSMPGYIVVIGTGKYLGDGDFVDTSTQTIYGIWDYGDDSDDSEYLGSFNRSTTPELSNQPDEVTLVEQTEIYYGQPSGSSNILRVLSQNQPDWVTVADSITGEDADPSNTEPNHAGWYFDLPISKERVIRNFVIRDGKAIIITSIPKSSPCEAGGDSILMEMDACAGGRLSDPQFDVGSDSTIDSSDLISIPNPDNGGDITVAPTGIHYPVMMYPPKILRMPDDTEVKYFSTAAGNILMIREAGEMRGIYYWRCVMEE